MTVGIIWSVYCGGGHYMECVLCQWALYGVCAVTVGIIWSVYCGGGHYMECVL